jgi:hypothetical protein
MVYEFPAVTILHEKSGTACLHLYIRTQILFSLHWRCDSVLWRLGLFAEFGLLPWFMGYLVSNLFGGFTPS